MADALLISLNKLKTDSTMLGKDGVPNKVHPFVLQY